MDVAVVGAIAAVVAVPVGVIQWLSAKAQARSAEVDLLREMRSDWLPLKPQWHRAILTAIGPESYYSPADAETRARFNDLIIDIVAEPQIEDEGWSSWHRQTRDRSHEFEQAERDVLFFLATLASVVFRGRLSADLAYTVVGLDVVRRSRQVRVLLGEASADWVLEAENAEEPEALQSAEISVGDDAEQATEADGEDTRAQKCPWGYWADSLPGLSDRILGLLDVLWAEAARHYDMQTHDLVAAAELKRRSGSGLRNRLRVRRLAREHGSRLTGWHLERALLAGEFVRLGPPRRFMFSSLEFVPPPLRGWGLKGRLRRSLRFWSGKLHRAPRGVSVDSPYEPWGLELYELETDPSSAS